MKKIQHANCIDIIRPYINEVTKKEMPPIQLLGGVGSVALLHERTVIKADERRVIAPETLYLSNFREDGNKRDVETLVLSNREEDVDVITACAKRNIGSDLLVEVFPFKDSERTKQLIDAPFSLKALTATLSDRYLHADTVWAPGLEEPAERVLFPFAAPIVDAALETWTLEVDGRYEMPVPSPGAVILNYLTRSVSGLRGKDKTKVEDMARAVFEKSPEMVEWITDGPGSTQFELARIFHTLQESKRKPTTLTLGQKLTVEPLSYKELAHHPNFLLGSAGAFTQKNTLRLAAIKSRGLHFFESIPFVVTPFQRYIEPRISTIVHNK